LRARLATILATVWLAGCAGPSWQVLITSSSGVERMRGVLSVAERKDWSAIPLVIDRLSDDDPSVRLAASNVLRDMTGQQFGYEVYAPEEKRAEAVQRWKQWWETEGKTKGKVEGLRSKV
jgi:hypothetical protein